MVSIGEKVRTLRERLEISQAELARRVGIKQPSLWAIENDRTKCPKHATLQRLADELHTTEGFLLGTEADDSGHDVALMESELTHALRSLAPERRLELVEYARWLLARPGAKIAPVAKKAGNVAPMKKMPKRPPKTGTTGF